MHHLAEWVLVLPIQNSEEPDEVTEKLPGIPVIVIFGFDSDYIIYDLKHKFAGGDHGSGTYCLSGRKPWKGLRMDGSTSQ